MNNARKLENRVVLFVAIEEAQREALRKLAFERKTSMADVVREAITAYIGVIVNGRPEQQTAGIGKN